MKIKEYDINQLIFAEYNPRQLTKQQYAHLKDSIKRFGLVDPILVNVNKERKNIIIGGHQRVTIARDLKIKKVPCVELDLTLEKERELNIRLNQNTGEWDFDTLGNLFDLDELVDWGFTDHDLKFFDDLEEDNNYSRKVESPIYETKNTKPKIKDLFDDSKVDDLIEDIDQSDLDPEEKKFLKTAAMRHTVFNYSKIADYYAHSEKETQVLMEDSALVIIDFKKAIEKGYVKLSEKISDQYFKEYANEE
tara:strand:- start:1551 stop:2297 length:747 start_codon:yes stop_codon:yes gene_type:complete